MYTQFYGLREKPFSLSPDPSYLFLSDPHREALAHLLYGIEQGEGFISITGEVGTGKTTLCRTILQRLDASTEVAFIFNPQLSGLELVQAINAELGLPTEDLDRRQLMEQLNRFLLTRKREGRRVLLIIDEAQVMEPDALEQVRLLSNLETNTSKLIQIILIGQPELDTKLESPDLRQLRQRISVRWRLDPLSANDTRDYVRHRLRVAAGAPRELFTDLALREIHRRSGGVPRVINLLCDRALLAGYAANAEAIGLGLVSQTDREVGAGRNASARRTGTWLSRLGLSSALSKISLPSPSGGWHLPSWVRDGALPIAVGLGFVTLAVGGWLMLDPRSGGPEDRQFVAAAPAAPPAAPERSDTEPASVAEMVAARIAAARLAEGGELPSVSSAPPAVPLETEIDPFADLPRPSELPLSTPDLGTALGRSSPAVTIASSLDAVLTLWSEPAEEAELLSLARMVEIFRARGFSLLNLRDARLETLAALDLPAVIVLRAVDGAPRYAAVTGLDGDALLLEGIHPGTLRAEASEIAESWSGEAFVPWRDFETLPSVLRPGASGDHVAWLQKSLTQLGVYRGPKTGTYDPATIQGVRALQERLELGIDGTVGPVTKIRLYRALPSYVVPVLKRPPPAARSTPAAPEKVSS